MSNGFSEKTSTAIWNEIPSPKNPYIAQSCRLQGYELFDIAKNCSYVDTLFLLFTGELPNKHQAEMLSQLMIFLINPGPRHSATRAAMTAGVSKTDHCHILPIGLTVLGGAHLGSIEVEKSVEFITQNVDLDPIEIANERLTNFSFEQEGDNRVAPGFGSRFGTTDFYAENIATHLCSLAGSGKALKWCSRFIKITSKQHMSWLNTGIAAAIFTDLGFGPREAAGLFQLISAPGILAHGLEQTHKPITAMPLIEDENYVIESKS